MNMIPILENPQYSDDFKLTVCPRTYYSGLGWRKNN